MSNEALRSQVTHFFNEALSLVRTDPSLRGLQRELEDRQLELGQPMRVAVVGKIKTGKSTMLNSLLGEALLATGTVETTFNVNWLKYAPAQSLVVHYKNGRPPEVKSPAELTELTKRSEQESDLLLSIKHIEVHHPNAVLQSFDLIDTPGLASFFEDDEKNTRDFLQLHGEELTQSTQRHAANADAILYLFAKSVSEPDLKVLLEFQKSSVGRTTPFNSIGILTRVDENWPACAEPMAAGQQITERLMTDHPELPMVFYKLHPVTGLMGLGAQTLTDDDFAILTQLAALPEPAFAEMNRTARRFKTLEFSEISNAPSAAQRAQVCDRIGRYAIHTATHALRAGKVTTREELSELLFNTSGVAELRQLIQSHFGNRAFLIKLNNCVQNLKQILFHEERRQTGPRQETVRTIAGWLGQLESNELFFQSLRELETLRLLYEEGKLTLDPEEREQLLQVTGERGESCAARLGLSEDTSLKERQARAQSRMTHWRGRANDIFGSDADTVRAAEILAQSYERILYHILQAQDDLQLDGYGNPDRQDLAQDLYQCGAVPEFASLGEQIPDRLDDPASLRQLDEVLQKIKQLYFRAQSQQQGETLKQLQHIAYRVEKLEVNEHGLQELKVLENYESGQLELSEDEVQQLLQVTGQTGTSCTARLGFAQEVPLQEMCDRAQAHMNHWLARANDIFSGNAPTIEAAHVLYRSYERIRYHIDLAQQHLQL